MNFEKWQALGNDYMIVEQRDLPFALTPARVRRLCEPHTGVGSDGILLLSEADEPGYLARMRIFNPDGSEAEVSGNGAREAILYLRQRGWTEQDTFSLQTAAGELRPRITSASTCVVDMGRARVRSSDYPSGESDGRGELTLDGQPMAFQHIHVGNPQCVFAVPDEATLRSLDLTALGPLVVGSSLFPNRTNASWYAALTSDRIRARIFERGAGETTASGTGAIGAAVAHVLAGGDSPVTVQLDGGELEVEVGEDLHVDLAGWAVPVYSASLSAALLEELDATE